MTDTSVYVTKTVQRWLLNPVLTSLTIGVLTSKRPSDDCLSRFKTNANVVFNTIDTAVKLMMELGLVKEMDSVYALRRYWVLRARGWAPFLVPTQLRPTSFVKTAGRKGRRHAFGKAASVTGSWRRTIPSVTLQKRRSVST